MSLYGGVELVGMPDLENVRKLDLLPMRSIREIMNYGFAIDREHLAALTDVLTNEMTELRRKVCEHIPADALDQFMEAADEIDNDDRDLPLNVDSAVQVRKLVFKVLGIGSGRKLKLTKGGEISTGKRQFEALKREHGVVADVLAYRERSKLKGTYTVPLPLMAKFHPASTVIRPLCPLCRLRHLADTWRIHTTVLTTRTATGRPATKNPNTQNIPIRSKHGQNVRRAFIASPGTELVSVDFGQLELRILAHVARVALMIKTFHEDGDVHTVTAMEAFQLVEELIDKLLHRAPAKNVNFAICFGETPQGLLEQLVSDTYGKSGIEVPDWLTLDWCTDFMENKWHGIYPEVRPYMGTQDYCARRYGVSWSLFGRCRKIPEVKSVHKNVVAAGLRQCGNMKIQGTGSDMLKLAQAELQDWIEAVLRPNDVWCQPVNEVHDELIYEVEEGIGKYVLRHAVEIMSRVMVEKSGKHAGRDLFRVPIKAEGHISQRWEKG